MESLVEKFKRRTKEIDLGMELAQELPPAPVVVETPKPTEEKPIEETGRRFNIFKRSLPVGINKLVYHNVPERDKNILMKSFLKIRFNNHDELVYWDPIEVTHTDPYNVYSNEGVATTLVEVE